MRDGKRRRAGELEALVLGVLWAADAPMTPAEVQQALGADLAYTTVMTILSRLHVKGLAHRSPAGRAYAYRPAAGQAEYTAGQMHALLGRGSDRAAVLAHFVGELSEAEERLLRSLLVEAGAGPDGSER